MIGDKLMVVGEGPDGCEGAGEMAVADVGTT